MPRKDVEGPVEIWPGAYVAERRAHVPLGSDLPGVDRSDWRPPSPRGELPIAFMLDMISLFVGIIALMLLLFAAIPFIATADWLVVPMALAGLALGLLSGSAAGRNLNLLVIVIGLVVAAMGL